MKIIYHDIYDVVEAAFQTLYPNAYAVLTALQAGIQTHGLMAAA